MADSKISDLTEATVPVDGRWLPMAETDTSETRINPTNLLKYAPHDWTFLVASNDATAQTKFSADYVCDGTADDVQIQAALDALPSTGGRVLLSWGRFNIAAQVNINKHGVILEGQGWGDSVAWTEDSYGTTLTAISGITGAVLRVAVGAFMASNPVASCQLRNFMVDGQGSAGAKVGTGLVGIQFSSFSALIENVRVVNMTGHGIHVGGNPGTWSTYNTAIRGVLTSDNDGDGFRCGDRAEDLQIIQLVSHANKGYGFWTQGSANQLTNSHLYDNGDGGGTDGTSAGNAYIHVNAIRCKLIGNKFEHGEGQYGLYIAGYEAVVVGNTFHNSGDAWGNPATTSVTFQDTGDTVTQTDHRLLNGDAVQFSSITSTTGISINTTYYVVGRTSNTFQVSASVGGSALPLTTNGSGVLVRGSGGASRAHVYVGGSVSILSNRFGIKDSDFSIGSAVEVASGASAAYVLANSFQTGNADTSGFWNGVALYRSGAVLDTNSKATIVGNTGQVSNVGNLRMLDIIIDGGGATITTGVKGDRRSPINGTIERVSILADQTGSIQVDIWKDTYGSYPPVDADSITASAVPAISSATTMEDTTLTGWNKTVTAGDTFRFNVDSATTIQRATVMLYIRETV